MNRAKILIILGAGALVFALGVLFVPAVFAQSAGEEKVLTVNDENAAVKDTGAVKEDVAPEEKESTEAVKSADTSKPELLPEELPKDLGQKEPESGVNE